MASLDEYPLIAPASQVIQLQVLAPPNPYVPVWPVEEVEIVEEEPLPVIEEEPIVVTPNIQVPVQQVEVKTLQEADFFANEIRAGAIDNID